MPGRSCVAVIILSRLPSVGSGVPAAGRERKLQFNRVEVAPPGEYNGRVHQWRYRLTVRTEPSQGLNTGSIPVSATMFPITYGRRGHRRSHIFGFFRRGGWSTKDYWKRSPGTYDRFFRAQPTHPDSRPKASGSEGKFARGARLLLNGNERGGW